MEATLRYNFEMNKFLLAFSVLIFLLVFSPETSAQEKLKNQIGLSFDFIHSWSKTYNLQQGISGKTYDLSHGITLEYERILKDKYFLRAKVGYYYIVNSMNFPGEFPNINHSMERIGQNHLDAVPLGLNFGVLHQINNYWTLSFHLGIYSYLLYSPIPRGYTDNLNPFLNLGEGAEITTRIISGTELYSTDFIHSYEIGHTISYRLRSNKALSLYLNNNLRVGFRPYMNYEMVVFTTGSSSDAALWNAASSILSSLFFTSIGIRYGF